MTGRALRAIAFVAFCSCAPLCVSASDLGPGVIAAIVRDSSGKPVPGMLVVAQGPTRRQATTTVAGIVTLVALPIGTYDVRVSRAGFATATRRVDVSSDPQSSALSIAVTRTSLAQSQGIASAIESVSLADDPSALVGNAIATTQEAQLTAVRGTLSGAAPTLLGTDANETRVELDGIPIAGGATSFAALRFRSAVGLNSIAFERGPVVVSPTVQGAIGGVIDYRTADFQSLAQTAGEVGYSSTFGSFQHVDSVRSFGPLAVVADAVTGGGENRSQTLKARYALSRSTSLDFAAYGSQSSTTIDGAGVATIAPAYAGDIRTSLGGASLQVRAFGSSVATSTMLPLAIAGANETDRTRGIQGSFDLPFGEDLASVTFDRRSDYATLAQTSLARTYTSVTARAAFQIAPNARLELGDDYSGGTSLAKRNDPQAGYARSFGDRVTIRASLGSSYAVAPDDLVLAAPLDPAALRPETAFGYRLALDDEIDGTDRIAASIFELRRFDRFATYAAARAAGVDIGFTHHPNARGFGGDADLTLERASAYGPVQPAARIADALDGASLAQLAGDPSYTLHTKLSYQTKNGFSLGLVDTLLGSNNGLAARAIGFVDLTAEVPLGNLGLVRLGENNALGTKVSQAFLAPYYRPHEFTIVYGLRGRSQTP